MTISLGYYPVVLLLVLFRIGGILFTLPFYGIPAGNGFILAGVSFPLALLFCQMVTPEWVAAAGLLASPGALAFAILGEALLGAAIGTVCGIFIGAFDVAGSIAASATSLAMAEELDPISGESASVMTQVWRQLFMMIVVTSGSHLLVFRVVGRTFEEIPVPWVGWMNNGLDLALVGGVAFRAGVTIALPVMVVSLLVSAAMGLMGRMASEFNVLFLSLPFRLTIGIFTMAMAILYSGDVLESMAQQMLTTVARYLGW